MVVHTGNAPSEEKVATLFCPDIYIGEKCGRILRLRAWYTNFVGHPKNTYYSVQKLEGSSFLVNENLINFDKILRQVRGYIRASESGIRLNLV